MNHGLRISTFQEVRRGNRKKSHKQKCNSRILFTSAMNHTDRKISYHVRNCEVQYTTLQNTGNTPAGTKLHGLRHPTLGGSTVVVVMLVVLKSVVLLTTPSMVKSAAMSVLLSAPPPSLLLGCSALADCSSMSCKQFSYIVWNINGSKVYFAN